jgi:hypothetical protein
MIRTRLVAAAVGVLAAGTVLAIAAPAMALPTLPPLCAASATPPPLYTARCTPTVTGANPIPAGGGSVTLTLPGVGSIMITVDGSGNLTAPTVTAQGLFAMGTLSVNNNTGLVSVTFTNKAAVLPPGVKAETYAIRAKVSPLPGSPGGFAVQAIAKPVTREKDDEGKGDDQGHHDSESSSGGAHEQALLTAGHGHSHGGGGGGGGRGD